MSQPWTQNPYHKLISRSTEYVRHRFCAIELDIINTQVVVEIYIFEIHAHKLYLFRISHSFTFAKRRNYTFNYNYITNALINEIVFA